MRSPITAALLLACAGVWGGWVPATAGAYPLPGSLDDGQDYSSVCPPRPADLSSGTVTEVELRYQSQAAADACVRLEQRDTRREAALATVASTAATTVNDAAARADEVKTTLVSREAVTDGKLDAAASAAAAAAAGQHADLASLHTDNATTSGDITTAQSASADVGNGLHSDVWFVAGIAASSLAGYALYRTVMPRA